MKIEMVRLYLLLAHSAPSFADQTKLNVWILDGDVVHSHLLKFALNAENFGECVVVIMVSMAEPWNIVESLEKWADILSKHIKRLAIRPETLTDYKNGRKYPFYASIFFVQNSDLYIDPYLRLFSDAPRLADNQSILCLFACINVWGTHTCTWKCRWRFFDLLNFSVTASQF